MYQFKPSQNLLPVMPGDRLYGVSRNAIEDEEYYAEGVVVTEDSLQVVLNGEVYDLGDGLFASREDALAWIEKNRRPTILESLISFVRDRFIGDTQIYYPRRKAQEVSS